MEYREQLLVVGTVADSITYDSGYYSWNAGSSYYKQISLLRTVYLYSWNTVGLEIISQVRRGVKKDRVGGGRESRRFSHSS